MEIKKTLQGWWRYAKRGFRPETFDITTASGDSGLRDYCAVLRIEPGGFQWAGVKVVVSGPVPIGGELDIVTRQIRRESGHRYTLTFRGKPSTGYAPVSFAVPVNGEEADIGRVGVYYELGDGTIYRHLSSSNVVLKRGKVLNITVPPPSEEAHAGALAALEAMKATRPQKREESLQGQQ